MLRTNGLFALSGTICLADGSVKSGVLERCESCAIFTSQVTWEKEVLWYKMILPKAAKHLTVRSSLNIDLTQLCNSEHSCFPERSNSWGKL